MKNILLVKSIYLGRFIAMSDYGWKPIGKEKFLTENNNEVELMSQINLQQKLRGIKPINMKIHYSCDLSREDNLFIDTMIKLKRFIIKSDF